MPCIGCLELFELEPCCEKTSEIKLNAKYYPKTLEIVKLIFHQLKKACPCKMCIVRAMCQTRCDKYNDLLDRI